MWGWVAWNLLWYDILWVFFFDYLPELHNGREMVFKSSRLGWCYNFLVIHCKIINLKKTWDFFIWLGKLSDDSGKSDFHFNGKETDLGVEQQTLTSIHVWWCMMHQNNYFLWPECGVFAFNMAMISGPLMKN